MWRQPHSQSFCACACGPVHILDGNVVFSCGVGGVFNYFVHVRMVQCAFWSATKCFVVVAAAFSVILRLCVVLLFFGAGHRESYWNGCIQVAVVIRQIWRW